MLAWVCLLGLVGCGGSNGQGNSNENDNSSNGNMNGNDNGNTNGNDNSNTNDNMNPSACVIDGDCSDGHFCEASICLPLPQMVVELGFTDPVDGTYRVIGNEEAMPMFAGFQGLSELLVTLRVTGLPANSGQTLTIDVTQSVTLVENNLNLNEFSEQGVTFTGIGPEEVELAGRRLILDAAPGSIIGRMVEVSFTLSTQIVGRPVNDDFSQQVLLELYN